MLQEILKHKKQRCRCVPKIGFLEFTRKTNYEDKSALFQNYVAESALNDVFVLRRFFRGDGLPGTGCIGKILLKPY